MSERGGVPPLLGLLVRVRTRLRLCAQRLSIGLHLRVQLVAHGAEHGIRGVGRVRVTDAEVPRTVSGRRVVLWRVLQNDEDNSAVGLTLRGRVAALVTNAQEGCRFYR
jgi:hypothetical protein